MKFRALDFDYDAEAAAIAANHSDSMIARTVVIIPCGVYERDRLWKQWVVNQNRKRLRNEKEDAARKILKQMNNDTPPMNDQAAISQLSINTAITVSFPIPVENGAKNDPEIESFNVEETFHNKQPENEWIQTKHKDRCFTNGILAQASILRLTSVPWHDDLRILSRPKTATKPILYDSPTLQRQLPSISYRIGPSHSESVFQTFGHRLRVQVASFSPPSISFSWLALMRGDHSFGDNKVQIRKKQPTDETAIVPYVPSFGVRDYLTLAVRIAMAAMESQVATNAEALSRLPPPQTATHFFPNDQAVCSKPSENVVREEVDEPWPESNEDFVFSPVKLSHADRQDDDNARAKKKAKKEMKKKRRRERKRDQKNNPENNRESKKQRKAKNLQENQEADDTNPQKDESAIRRVCVSDRLGTVDTKKGPKSIAHQQSGKRAVAELRKPRWVEGLRSKHDAGLTQSDIERPSLAQTGTDSLSQEKYGSLRLQHSKVTSSVGKPIGEDRRSTNTARAQDQLPEATHDPRVNQSKTQEKKAPQATYSSHMLHRAGATEPFRLDARKEDAASNIQQPHALPSKRVIALKGNGITSASQGSQLVTNESIRVVAKGLLANENINGVKRSGPVIYSNNITVHPRNSIDFNPGEPTDGGNNEPLEYHTSVKLIHPQPFLRSQAFEHPRIASLKEKEDKRIQTSSGRQTNKEPTAHSDQYTNSNDHQHMVRRKDINVKPGTKHHLSTLSEKQNEQLSQSITRTKQSEPPSYINTRRESNHANQCSKNENSILFNSFRNRVGGQQPGKPQGPLLDDATSYSMGHAMQQQGSGVDDSNPLTDKQASYYKWAVADADAIAIPSKPTPMQSGNRDGLSQREIPGQSKFFSTVRCLCSESFLETNAEIVAELAAGTWSRTTSNQMVGLVDTPLLDRCKVDIETPDRRGIVIRKASQISTPEDAKSTILFLVELAAMQRYDCITVFILLDLQNSAALPVYLAKIHCAVSGCPSKTAIIPIPSGHISSAIAKLVLCRRKPAPEQATLDDQATELVATSNSLAIDRASFLLDLMPSLSAYGALQCILLVDQLTDHGDVGGFASLFNDKLLRQITLIISRKDTGIGINPSAMTHLSRLIQAQL